MVDPPIDAIIVEGAGSGTEVVVRVAEANPLLIRGGKVLQDIRRDRVNPVRRNDIARENITNVPRCSSGCGWIETSGGRIVYELQGTVGVERPGKVAALLCVGGNCTREGRKAVLPQTFVCEEIKGTISAFV